MKLIWMAVVLVFIANIGIAECDDDSSESAERESNEIKSNKTTLDKPKKFMVTIKPPNSTPYVIPKRSERKPFMPKFQLKRVIENGKATIIFPSTTTKRPHLMKTKTFTSKPHITDGTRTLLEINNFNKKRTPKFNKSRTEEKPEKKYNNKHSINSEDHFQNFKNIDNSSEDDSEESKKTAVVPRRRFMKTAASNKVKTVIPTPIKPNVTVNYKIKELLKNQKIAPKMEMKRIVPIDVQKSKNPANFENKYKRTTLRTPLEEAVNESQANMESSTKNKIEDSPGEKADANEFIFVKDPKNNASSSTIGVEEKEIVTTDPINGADTRPKRSINVIEEEQSAPTKSSVVKYRAGDWPLSSVFTFKNIHA